MRLVHLLLSALCAVCVAWPASAAGSGTRALGATARVDTASVSVAPAYCTPSSVVPLLRLRLAAQDGPARVTGLRLTELGTAPAASLRLQAFRGGQPVAANVSFDSAARAWTLTFAKPDNLPSGGYVWYEFREAAAVAALGATLQLGVVAASDVLADVPVTGRWPLASGITRVAPPARLRVDGYSPAPAVAPVAAATTILRLRLEAANAAVNVAGFQVRETGSAPVESLGLSVFVAGKAVPASVILDAGRRLWQVVLTKPVALKADGYVYFELRETATWRAAGKTMRLAVDDAAMVQADAPVSTNWPVQSPPVLVGPAPKVLVEGYGVAPASAEFEVPTAMLRLRLEASGGPVVVRGFRLLEAGSAPLDALSVGLVKGGNTLPASVTADAAARSFALTLAQPVALAPGAYAWLTVNETSAAAGKGATMALALAALSDVTVDGEATGALPLSSGPTLVTGVEADRVDVSGYELPPAKVQAGVPCARLQLAFTAQGGGALLSGLTLAVTGTAPLTPLAPQLTDANGTALATTATYDPAGRVWRLALATPLKLTATVPRALTVWQTVGFEALYQTTGLTVPDAAAVTATSPVAGSFPIASSAALVVATESDALTLTVPSSLDGTWQPSLFYVPAAGAPLAPGTGVPLLVGLHTSVARFDQAATYYLSDCKHLGWALIAPDFRGPNDHPEASQSALAVQDVLDAVAYAQRTAHIDATRIYVIGHSGGGGMALMLAAKAPRLWAGVHAMGAPTDLATWYWWNVGKAFGYDRLLALSCGGPPGTPATDQQYHDRSPLFFLDQAGGVPVTIDAGLHDGHGAPVPIEQMLRGYNVLAAANGRADLALTAPQIATMTDLEVIPPELANERVQDPLLPYTVMFQRIAAAARIRVFDGRHFTTIPSGLAWLARQRLGQPADFSLP